MSRRWRKRLIVVGAVALLVLGGVYLWQRTRPGPAVVTAVPPPIPDSVVDPEVRAALTQAREKVLSEPLSGQSWGELGLSFRAHNLNVESNGCFAVATQLDPRNPRWPYLIGVINLLITPDDAIPHLQKAYDLAEEPTHRSLIRLRLAEALVDKGDLDTATKLFNEEVRTNPQSPRALFGLGTLAVARGDDQAAIAPLLVALDSPFAHKKAAALLAASHRRLKHLTEAERFERESARAGDDLPWPDLFISEYARREAGRSARMKAIEELEASNRLPEAVAGLEDVARTNPDDQVLVSLGINLGKMGEFARAERALRVVRTRTPNHAVARYFLGIALFMQAEQAWQSGDRDGAKPRFEEAIKELRKAVELNPERGLAHLYAGQAWKYLGNLPEAEAECRAAVRASPQFGETHLGLGEVLVERGKPSEAIPYLETAIRLAPSNDTRAKVLLEKCQAKKP